MDVIINAAVILQCMKVEKLYTDDSKGFCTKYIISFHEVPADNLAQTGKTMTNLCDISKNFPFPAGKYKDKYI